MENYYMISIYTNEATGEKNYRPFINPYNSLKDIQNAVNWQSHVHKDNIITKRVSKSEFINIHTKERIFINIEDRTPYTVEAWNEFLNYKSKECKKVLVLMDKDFSYTEALNKVLKESKDINKLELEKELNKFI